MTLALGIIGMGYCGRQQLLAAASVPGIKVIALADAAPLDDLARAGTRAIYKDWRRLLEDPAVEAVSLCVPHDLHREIALAALKAGKHVLLEKPLAARLEEAREIVAAAKASPKKMMIEMTHRFFPSVREGRDLVRSGRLGKIYAVEDRVIERIVPERCPGWLFDGKRAGGGVAITDAIHMLDRISWVCGQSLRFLQGKAGYDQRLGDVEDTAVMLLSLSEGAPVSLLTSFQRQGAALLDDELTVYGTKGTLRIWAWRGWRFEPGEGAPEEHPSYPADTEFYVRVRTGMTGALAEFASAIAEGRAPSPSADELLPSQEVIDQFYRQTKA